MRIATGDYLRVTSPSVRRTNEKLAAQDKDIAETIVKLIAPIVPHIAEELWQKTLEGTGSVHKQDWPTFDASLCVADQIEIAIQINGKVKTRIMIAADASEADAISAAREAVADALANGDAKKEIYVAGRLVNLVVK